MLSTFFIIDNISLRTKCLVAAYHYYLAYNVMESK